MPRSRRAHLMRALEATRACMVVAVGGEQATLKALQTRRKASRSSAGRCVAMAASAAMRAALGACAFRLLWPALALLMELRRLLRAESPPAPRGTYLGAAGLFPARSTSERLWWRISRLPKRSTMANALIGLRPVSRGLYVSMSARWEQKTTGLRKRGSSSPPVRFEGSRRMDLRPDEAVAAAAAEPGSPGAGVAEDKPSPREVIGVPGLLGGDSELCECADAVASEPKVEESSGGSGGGGGRGGSRLRGLSTSLLPARADGARGGPCGPRALLRAGTGDTARDMRLRSALSTSVPTRCVTPPSGPRSGAMVSSLTKAEPSLR
mmetsp:Transcript_7829/g.23075  ORF Transcript_7829/g.23075 Transcript_7829/m.23075 type:complete len:323 (+) Transcript_7829:1213-2181(+)